MLRDQVRCQVERLIPLFGVDMHRSCILRSFEILCSESLCLDVGQRSAEFSRINADGTPFQFSLHLSGRDCAPLQFLSEAGRPGCDGRERLRASYAALVGLARVCGISDQVDRLFRVLRDFVPVRDWHLERHVSGFFWLALSFWPDQPPALTVYIDGRQGSEAERWARLDQFSDLFGSNERWHALAASARPALAPLGMAVTLRSHLPASGRIYLHAFGERLNLYRTLFLHFSSTPDRVEAFTEFGRQVLGEDADYPTRSAVFSIECPPTPTSGAKFEICAHCAFAHEAEAGDRITRWLRRSSLDEAIYQSTVSTLMQGRPLPIHGRPSLHAYVGVGVRGSSRYASIYLNPGPALEGG